MTGSDYDEIDHSIPTTNYNGSVMLKIKNSTSFATHRSGWNYVMTLFDKYRNNNDGILVIDFIEKYFSWDCNYDRTIINNTKSVRLGNYKEMVPIANIRNFEGSHMAWLADGRRAYWSKSDNKWIDHTEYPIKSMESYKLAYRRPAIINEPWIGFWHNPPNMDSCDIGKEDKRHSPKNLLRNPEFLASLKKCIGIVVFSEYMAQWVRGVLNILDLNASVSSLFHPTESVDLKFSYPEFKNTQTKTVVQIGYWLRDMEAIWKLKLSDEWKKVWLYGGDKALQLFEQKLTGDQKDQFNVLRTDNSSFKWDGVDIMRCNNADYDEILHRSIGFAYLYDSSCNNAVIECIIRKTPLLINKIPAVVEYLGTSYPFYYSSFDEACAKLNNPALIEETIRYIESMQCPCSSYLTGESFMESFLDSTVCKTIKYQLYWKQKLAVVQEPIATIDDHVDPDPIDAVITWVDGTDPVWYARWLETTRKYYHDQHNGKDSNTVNRFRSNFDEIKYCLRGLNSSMPWLRNIYLVVDDVQTLPSWLDLTKIHVVRHSEIFDDPENQLPTFNSVAIESCLHRIPGLSEKFIYLNDDMFVLQEWNRDDFFQGDTPIVNVQNNELAHTPYPDVTKIYSYDQAWNYMHDILDRTNGHKTRCVLIHAPVALTKSMVSEVEDKFEQIRSTRYNRFKSNKDIMSIMGFVQYYNEDKVIFGTISSGYVSTKKITKDTDIVKTFGLADKRVINIQDETLNVLDDAVVANIVKTLDSLLPKSRFES